MTERTPDMTVNLTWLGEERFKGVAKNAALELDGKGEAAVSPVQALALSLGGCMGIDVADILVKGRLPLLGLSCELRVYRAVETPRRIVGVDLEFAVQGEVPGDRIARAIELSKEKYCSVWHSLHPDIEFKTSYVVTA